MRFALLVFVLGCLMLPAPAQTEGSEGSEEGSGPDFATSSPDVVLTGLDPVSLVDGREEKGRADWRRVYKGFEYRFASAEHRGAFDADPDRYAVVDEGNCPVAAVRLKREMKGKPDVFAVRGGRIYLFGNQDARRAFLENPEAFTDGSEAEASEEEGSGSM